MQHEAARGAAVVRAVARAKAGGAEVDLRIARQRGHLGGEVVVVVARVVLGADE